MNSPEVKSWKDAMDEEICTMMKRKVWHLVPRPEKAKIVGCRWVYTNKKDQTGNVVKFKARLVAQGFSQLKGINYDEVFSPVINFSLIRLFFTILVSFCCWSHTQIDITCAYLYANLKEKVFMRQPKGYEDQDHPNHVCLLHKAIYGLKQSGREWFHELSSVLEDLKFRKLKWANGVFHKAEVVLLLYVDDIIVLGKTESCVLKAINILETRFDLKILGRTKTLLGVQFSETNGMVCIDQTQYIEEIYQRFSKFNPPITSLPIAKGTVYSKSQRPSTESEIKEMSQYPYRSLIGCLAFLAARTRPDISFAVNLFSQFQSDPGLFHWIGLLKLLGYVYATKDLKLDLTRTETLELNAYCDADYATSRDDRQSIGGFIVFVDKSPVVWRTAKQRCVTLSSMESEFLSITDSCKELLWLRNVIMECGVMNIFDTSDFKCTLFSDNEAAIAFSKSPVENSRTKHIDVRFHFIRDLLAKNVFILKHVRSKNNLSDVFTKPQTKNQLQKFNENVFLNN